MKYLLFSDLHGSASGLVLLKEGIERRRPDVVICLGDILYGAYDQDANACIEYLSSIHMKVVGVRGNCDYPMDAARLLFDLPEERKLVIEGHDAYLRHLPFWKNFERGDIALSGHTHRKTLYVDMGALFFNPGSIGKPRDDGPSYGWIHEGKAELVDALSGETIKSLALSEVC